MGENMSSLIRKAKYLFKDGFFGVIFANSFNKILSFCSGIIVVRILSKNDFGNYSYVMNIVNIALMLDGLGTVTGILQFGLEYYDDRKNRDAIIRYGSRLGVIFNVFLTIFIILFGVFWSNDIDNRVVLFLFAAVIPIPNFIVECFSTIIRVDKKNNKYAIFTSISCLVVYSMLLVGACIYSTEGAILFRSFGLVLTIIVSFIFLKKIRAIFTFKEKVSIDEKIKKEFLKFSIFSCINNSVALLFYNADLFLIGEMIADSELIASYKVATTIPLGLTFITSSIVIYVYPKFVQHRFDYLWLKKSYLKLVFLVFLINLSIALCCFVFSPQLIKIVFGEQYVDQSTPVFRILIIGFLISATFRVPAGNVLDMLHLVKHNLIISSICAGLNILIDILLIYFYGYIGAAVATLSIYCLYALLSNIIVFRYIKNGDVSKKQIDLD